MLQLHFVSARTCLCAQYNKVVVRTRSACPYPLVHNSTKTGILWIHQCAHPYSYCVRRSEHGDWLTIMDQFSLKRVMFQRRMENNAQFKMGCTGGEVQSTTPKKGRLPVKVKNVMIASYIERHDPLVHTHTHTHTHQ